MFSYYLSVRWSTKRNPQLGFVFDFEVVFPYPKKACVTQLYIVYYFFNFYFIYIRYAYAHTHAKGESKKVASCRLHFLYPPESVTLSFCNCNFATFGIRPFGV